MVFPLRLWSKTMVSPLLAAAMSARNEPGPLSRLLVTVSVLGTSRPSRTSSRGRKRGGFRLPAFGFRKALPIADRRLPIAAASQEKNDMMFLLSDLLAGETSPAFVFQAILSAPEPNA